MAITVGAILTAVAIFLFVLFIRRPDNKDDVAVGMASASTIVFILALWLGLLLERFL